MFADIYERTTGDRRQNRVGLRNNQVVVFVDKDDIGAARFFHISAGCRIQINVFSKAVTMSFHCRIQAHSIVKTGFDVTGTAGSGAIVVGHAHLQGLNGALEICAHRHDRDAEEKFMSRSNANLRAGADHERANIQRGTRAERRYPCGVGPYGIHNGLHELVFRECGHFQTARRVSHTLGIHVGTERDDATVFCGVGL